MNVFLKIHLGQEIKWSIFMPHLFFEARPHTTHSFVLFRKILQYFVQRSGFDFDLVEIIMSHLGWCQAFKKHQMERYSVSRRVARLLRMQGKFLPIKIPKHSLDNILYSSILKALKAPSLYLQKKYYVRRLREIFLFFFI